MSKSLLVGVSVIGVCLMLILPGAGQANGPGQWTNTVGNVDHHWQGNLADIMGFVDGAQGSWWTGAIYWYLDFRFQQGASLNRYIKAMTIPWIGIQEHNDVMKYYEHADQGSMNGQLLLNGQPTYNEGKNCNQNGYNGWTEFFEVFDLDYDGDGVRDWQFREEIDLYSPVKNLMNHNTGAIRMSITVPSYPWVDSNGNGVCDPGEWGTRLGSDGVTIIHTDKIVFPYYIDMDVYGSTNNDIYTWDNQQQQWNRQNNEMVEPIAAAGFGTCWVKVVKPNANPARDVKIWAYPNNNFPPTTVNIWCLKLNIGEFSQDPNNYKNNEGIVNTDVLTWYTEEFDVANQQFPPFGAGVNMQGGVFLDDLT
jgi:hypothetical protein